MSPVGKATAGEETVFTTPLTALGGDGGGGATVSFSIDFESFDTRRRVPIMSGYCFTTLKSPDIITGVTLVRQNWRGYKSLLNHRFRRVRLERLRCPIFRKFVSRRTRYGERVSRVFI